jgi:hypothetical protein
MAIRRRFWMSASQILLVIAWVLAAAAASTGDVSTLAAVDARGYGQGVSSAGALRLSYRYDEPQDRVWFRIALFPNSAGDVFGVSIAVDLGWVKGRLSEVVHSVRGT